jgi:hypothetical protein
MRYAILLLVLLCSILLIEGLPVAAQRTPLDMTITFSPFISGLNDPVDITHAGDGSGRLFMVGRGGRIVLWQNGTLSEVPFLDIGDMTTTEGAISKAENSNTSACGQPAANLENESDTGSPEDRSFSLYANWRGILVPGTDLYPRYIADPLRPMMAIQYVFVSESDIADAGDTRYLHSLGGRVGLLRVYRNSRSDAGFQIDLKAVYLGMFDIENATDNIGWDGFYGILLTWADGEGTAMKLGMQHDSSHLGDEYIERVGRTRIEYTRVELAFGVSRKLHSNLLVYGEGAYGYLDNISAQAPWRLQGGLQYEDDDQFFNGRVGWYSAVNVTSYEENDWDANVAIQAGLVAPFRQGGSSLRLGVAFYNGRSVIGEFFQSDEEFVSLGMWLDL